MNDIGVYSFSTMFMSTHTYEYSSAIKWVKLEVDVALAQIKLKWLQLLTIQVNMAPKLFKRSTFRCVDYILHSFVHVLIW